MFLLEFTELTWTSVIPAQDVYFPNSVDDVYLYRVATPITLSKP